jgi:tagatose-1,6-bisphosphate aldolase non-catalytic subunit AgaZ/GatZ
MTHNIAFRAHSTHYPRPVNRATLNKWHEIIGHLYPEALLKLREHILGIEITTSTLINPKYKDYYLSDSKRVPYQYPIARSTIPFKKLY